MRTIKELMSRYEQVWFYVSGECKQHFVEQCEKYGYHFNKGELLTSETCSPFMALQASNKTVWYISIKPWTQYLQSNVCVFAWTDGLKDLSVHVDYKSYITGEPRYVYKNRNELVNLTELFDETERQLIVIDRTSGIRMIQRIPVSIIDNIVNYVSSMDDRKRENLIKIDYSKKGKVTLHVDCGIKALSSIYVYIKMEFHCGATTIFRGLSSEEASVISLESIFGSKYYKKLPEKI